MNNLFFNPTVPTINMIIYSVILLIIVLINRKHLINRFLIILLFFICLKILIKSNTAIFNFPNFSMIIYLFKFNFISFH